MDLVFIREVTGMIDYRAIYQRQGELYDQLVTREDYRGNLLEALLKIHPFSGAFALDLGAGTGRLTRILGGYVEHMIAIDISGHMLEVAGGHLREAGVKNCSLTVADNRRLPVIDNSADISLAGWSIGHCISWYADSWRQQVIRIIQEMERVVRKRGTIVVIETLGTGRSTPAPPTSGLARFYGLLENEWGFQMTWVRTDYSFRSLSEAIKLSRFFFGDELAERVAREELTILPECTGIWWK